MAQRLGSLALTLLLAAGAANTAVGCAAPTAGSDLDVDLPPRASQAPAEDPELVEQSPDEGHEPEAPPFDGPTWKIVTLVYRSTDATISEGAAQRRFTSSMTPERYDAIKAAAKEVPAAVARWSGGHARAEMTIIDVPVLRQVSRVAGPSLCVWVSDVKDDLVKHAPAGTFDSVLIAFDTGTGANELTSCEGWGRSPGADTYGMTYGVVTSRTSSEDMIRQWLHGTTAFFRGKKYDVPSPYESRAYGFVPSAGGSLATWYEALMSGGLVDEGVGVGLSPAVWRSGTPTAWTGGTAAPTPASQLAKPVVRDARMWDPSWAYAEWSPVPGVRRYTVSLSVKKPDGSNGATKKVYESGGTDRGAYNYYYWSKATVCSLGKGQLSLRVRVAADRDPASESVRDLPSTVACP